MYIYIHYMGFAPQPVDDGATASSRNPNSFLPPMVDLDSCCFQGYPTPNQGPVLHNISALKP